ncbi:MAG: lysostaphin resistance A-like protein [Terriglobales bacterium]
MTEKSPACSTPDPNLSRLIYVLSAAGLAYIVASRMLAEHALKMFGSGSVSRAAIFSEYAYPSVLALFLLAMIAIAVAARVPREPAAGHGNLGAARRIGWGLLGGIVCCAAVVPVMLTRGGESTRFLVNAVANAYSPGPLALATILLLAAALPLASEVVFRGIILRTLRGCAGAPAAVVASTVLFAVWWPVLGWYGSAVLGLVSAVLYIRTRGILASVVANSICTVGSAAIVVAVAFR